MKRTLIAAVAALTAVTGVAGAATAQPYGHAYGHDQYDRHDDHGRRDWRRGGHIERSDWNRGARVDWRRHHLHQPPRGYEWREVDGNYVMAAAATGLIASIIANSR